MSVLMGMGVPTTVWRRLPVWPVLDHPDTQSARQSNLSI
jgi:hypothetical protein